MISSWLIGELAEAALHADRADEARAHLAAVEASTGTTPANWLGITARGELGAALAVAAPQGRRSASAAQAAADADA